MMPKVEIYTKSWCPYSARAKQHLDFKGVRYEEIDVTTDSFRRRNAKLWTIVTDWISS
jgi:glutaredoxin 3